MDLSNLMKKPENLEMPDIVYDSYMARKDALVSVNFHADTTLLCVINKLDLLQGKLLVRYFEVPADELQSGHLTAWMQNDENITEACPAASENTRCLMIHGATADEVDERLGTEEEDA